MARGYGVALYGDSLYGVTKYVDASASTTVLSGFTAASTRVRESDSLVAAQSSIASIAFSSLVAASAITTTSSLVNASQRIREVSATVSATASATATVDKIHLSGSSISAEVVTSVQPLVVYQGQANGSSSSTISANVNRLQPISSVVVVNATLDANAYYKYEPTVQDAEPWTDILADDPVWSTLSQDAETWVDVTTLSTSWTNTPPSGGNWTNT